MTAHSHTACHQAVQRPSKNEAIRNMAGGVAAAAVSVTPFYAAFFILASSSPEPSLGCELNFIVVYLEVLNVKSRVS